jgi:hypothetical protein
MRIKKSKLLVTFEALCSELEARPLRDIEVCAVHTRLAGKPAYVLSIPCKGLFVILAQDETPRHVQLISLRLPRGDEEEAEAVSHVVPDGAIRQMAFIATHFFYEHSRSDSIGDLYKAFPDVDNYKQVAQQQAKLLDLTGFMV